MKSVPFLFLTLCLLTTNLPAQDEHDHANAASIENEANSVTGWSGGTVISSDASDPQNGSFSIKAVSTASNGRTLSYTYSAQIGQQYIIRIWAKQGPQVSTPAAPAFALWSGMTGFSTTLIQGTVWAEYVFNVTATSTSPIIMIYTGLSNTRFTAGNTIFIDHVSILAVDSAPPSAVTTLAASSTTSTGTELTWSASTDNIGVTAYHVFRDGTEVGTTTVTNYTASGLTQSTSYNFSVLAADAAGNLSAAGNTVNVTTLSAADSEPPSAVTTLAASSTTSTGTELTWSASTDNIGVTAYHVFRDGTEVGTTTVTNYTASGLTQSTSYNFSVLAADAAGNLSAAGNTVNVTTLSAADSEPPSAVTTLAASSTTSTGTELTWSASTDNIGVTAYHVFRDGTEVGTTTVTNYTASGLTQSTSYNFSVLAEDAAGNLSAAGNTVNVTTLSAADSEPPSAVTTLAASSTTSTGTQLSWSASTDNIGVTAYHVFRDGTEVGTTTVTNYTASGLTQSTSYNFSVLAADAAGNLSAAGNTVNVTTLGSGGIVDYTSENANLATVDWQANHLFAAQAMGIGTTDTQGYALAVAGDVVAESVKIALQTNWPDFVFKKEYPLPSLEEMEKHITEKGYLLGLPSADEVKANGIDLGEMNALLLQKIEEITLYLIQQDKKIKELEKKSQKLESDLKTCE